MKITVTGSLGHIGKPLAEKLVQQGHEVRVISSTAERQAEIEALGATAAIGQLQDVDFLTGAFSGADAVYTMTPPPDLFAEHSEVVARFLRLGEAYRQAIEHSRALRIVHLSSVGAHLDKRNGILRYAYDLEQILKQLPSEVSVTFMRPVGFYYNLLSFIPMIKEQGVIRSNYGGQDHKPWVSPIDIADSIAEELTNPRPAARNIRYVASNELSCNEVARILGEAIGKPDLKWEMVSDEQVLNGMTAAGINPGTAKGFVEMNASMRSGILYEDYYRNRPALGKVKMTDYAGEFAKVYWQK
jgi:uncharacterized protein YbjT (DUF2867 family)